MSSNRDSVQRGRETDSREPLNPPTRGDVERLIEELRIDALVVPDTRAGRMIAEHLLQAADALQALTGEGKKDLESARGLGERPCGAPEENVAGIYKALPERIVAVACRAKGVVVDSPSGKVMLTLTLPAPARHHNILWGWGRVSPENQGFLTSEGRFVGRKEAAEIAMASGQVIALQSAPNLYSEDLW